MTREPSHLLPRLHIDELLKELNPIQAVGGSAEAEARVVPLQAYGNGKFL